MRGGLAARLSDQMQPSRAYEPQGDPFSLQRVDNGTLTSTWSVFLRPDKRQTCRNCSARDSGQGLSGTPHNYKS